MPPWTARRRARKARRRPVKHRRARSESGAGLTVLRGSVASIHRVRARNSALHLSPFPRRLRARRMSRPSRARPRPLRRTSPLRSASWLTSTRSCSRPRPRRSGWRIRSPPCRLDYPVDTTAAHTGPIARGMPPAFCRSSGDGETRTRAPIAASPSAIEGPGRRDRRRRRGPLRRAAAQVLGQRCLHLSDDAALPGRRARRSLVRAAAAWVAERRAARTGVAARGSVVRKSIGRRLASTNARSDRAVVRGCGTDRRVLAVRTDFYV